MAKRNNRLTTEAEKDIEEAEAYYHEINPGLASDFLIKAESLLDPIEQSPEQFPVVHESGVRRAVFPLSVHGHFLNGGFGKCDPWDFPSSH